LVGDPSAVWRKVRRIFRKRRLVQRNRCLLSGRRQRVDGLVRVVVVQQEFAISGPVVDEIRRVGRPEDQRIIVATERPLIEVVTACPVGIERDRLPVW
jgi:hypothetical protein